MGIPINKFLYSDNAGDSLTELNENFEILDDRALPSPEDGYCVSEPWIKRTIGGFLDSSTINGGLAQPFMGSLEIQTGTDAAGGVVMSTRPDVMNLTNGENKITFTRVYGSTFTYEVGQEFTLALGYSDAYQTVDLTNQADGAMYYIDTSVSTNWKCVTWVSGTLTEVADTGIAFDASAKRDFQIITGSGIVTFLTKLSSSADWEISHVETTSLPVGDFGVAMSYRKTLGTTAKRIYFGSVTVKHLN